MQREKEYFVLTLPLKLEPWQAHRLDKALEVNRQIYNAMLREGVKRYRQMAQTRAFRNVKEELKGCREPERRKQLYKELDGLREKYRLRPYDFSKDSTVYRKCFSENTDAPIVQNLAAQVSRAIAGLLDGRAERVLFKPREGLNCIAGKTNKTSIRFQDGMLHWKELHLKLLLKQNDYEKQALGVPIRFCRIKRKLIRGKYCYDAELVLKGTCPVKRKIPILYEGTVGIKSTLGSITAVSSEKIWRARIPGSRDALESERKELARRLERSRRAMNPENYEKNGTIRKGAFLWKQSINYRNLIKQYSEILRMQRVLRNEQQRLYMEELLELGTRFVYEEFSYQAMKYGGRKRENTAPAAFFKRFRWKAERQGRTCISVSPIQTRSSSFNHSTGEMEESAALQKFRRIEGQEVEHQCYGAFLLCHFDPVQGRISLEDCRREFPQFLELYQSYELRQAV